MREDDLKKFEERYRSLSTEELLQATTVEKDDYMPEAIALMTEELDKRNISQLEKAKIQTNIGKKVEEEKKSISGIRGLLLLFIIILLFNSLVSLIAGISIVSTTRSLLSTVISLPSFFIALYGIFVFFLLVLKKQNAPKHATNWIISAFIISLIYAAFSLLATGELPSFLLGQAISAGIWLGYFSYSKRIAATYGTSAD